MAIAMVSDDLGRSTALSLARSLVTYIVRPGGQSQFSEALELQAADGAGRFDELHKWMRSHLAQDLCNDRLADHMRMSTRNFSRLYASSVGKTPAKSAGGICGDRESEIDGVHKKTGAEIEAGRFHMQCCFHTRVLWIAPR